MEDNNHFNQGIADDIREYVKMHIDATKLRAVANLSTISGGAIALLICILFCMLALIIFSGAIVYGLGLLLNSPLWAALIIGVLYIVIGVVVFKKRATFTNMMVRVFSRMLFEDPSKGKE